MARLLQSHPLACPRRLAARSFEAVAAGCVPVLISDDIELPFKRWIDFDAFLVRVPPHGLCAPPEGTQRSCVR